MSKITNDEIKFENINSKGYGISPKLIWQDTRLSIESKAIYNYFSSYCGNGSKKAFPKLNTILHHLKISKNRYYNHLKPLIKLGFIEVIQRRKLSENGKWVSDSNLYVLKQFVDTNLCSQECIDENIANNKEYKDNEKIKENNDIKNNKNVESVQNTEYLDDIHFEEPQNKYINNNNNFNKNLSMYVRLYETHMKTTNKIKKFIYDIQNKISFDLFEKVLIEVLNNAKIIKKDVYFIKTIKAIIEKNIKTVTQYETSIEDYKEINKNKRLNQNTNPKKTKFHNFTETFTNYSEEELEEIILKSQLAKFA